MSTFVRLLVLTVLGLAFGLAFNDLPLAEDARYALGNGITPGSIDMFSYGAGLVTGMILWQVGSIPWAAMPKHFHQFLVSKVEFYKFLAIASACVAVLIYF